jgi:hypoxanthine phosphoribosyltransferase
VHLGRPVWGSGVLLAADGPPEDGADEGEEPADQAPEEFGVGGDVAGEDLDDGDEENDEVAEAHYCRTAPEGGDGGEDSSGGCGLGTLLLEGEGEHELEHTKGGRVPEWPPMTYAGGMFLDLEKVLISKEKIALRVHDLAAEIARDIKAELGEDGGEKVVLVSVLTGSIVFVADLIRQLPLKLSLGLVAVSSYPGTSMESKGAMMRSELPRNLAGKHVLVVDDILDSGQTLDVLGKLILEQKPASMRLCVLLRKPGKAKVAVKADYVGFDIPDEFVVGYGLDYDGFYRNYPEIATLKAEVANRK